MNKIIGRYYKAEQICIFSLQDEEGLSYAEILSRNHIKINVESKEVQKVHSFFQNIIIEETISEEFNKFELDCSKISHESFFDVEFKKLIDFLSQQVEVANTTIDEIKGKNQENEEVE